MYENNTGGAVIKGNQNQGDCGNRDDITHSIRIVEQIENHDSSHEHDPYRKGIGNIHRPIEEAWLHFITQSAR